ncbi:MAG: hypothetical protein GY895_15455, partial [Phycisphaera sp.]|nr:hypothetical protein [Phycisphaera sp.]
MKMIRTTLTVMAAAAIAAPASAEITGAYTVDYSTSAADFDGGVVTVNVKDLYLSSDDAADTVLNVYNMNMAESGMVTYFQSFTGTGWQP